MDSVKSFLQSHSSASVSLIARRLEIPPDLIRPLITKALQELGRDRFRVVYSVANRGDVAVCSEKSKAELESKYGCKAQIYAVQRITDSVKNLYNAENAERNQVIEEEIKNGRLYLPIYSINGAYPQDRREYDNQKKLNFKSKKPSTNLFVKETKPQEPKPQKPKEYELEEESFIRYPTTELVSFSKIAELNVDDMADIMDCDLDRDVILLGETRPKCKKQPNEEVKKNIVKDNEKDQEDEYQGEIVQENMEKKPQNQIIKSVFPNLPAKRKAKFVEPTPKKVYRESIIPMANNANKKNKMSQASLANFFKN